LSFSYRRRLGPPSGIHGDRSPEEHVMKILVVDDEPHIRSLLEQTLEELEEDHGVTVLSASDGEEGLAVIERERPELVFLDIMMPGLNGYEVCRAVKEREELAGTHMILLTAKGQAMDREEGLASGAVDYMTKPFDPDLVLNRALEILGL
jgi:two-component system, OmpR family, alkaline phosphatase synthesis response regulator PhoP